MKALVADKVLIEGIWHENLAVIIQDGRILSTPSKDTLDPTLPVENLGDAYLAPGFFDIQVNGGGGVFLNQQPTLDGLKTVAQVHRKFGTTSLLPTLISDTWEVMVRMADAVEEALDQKIPGIRGIHFEGPYLNQDRKGVHDAHYIRNAEEKFLDLVDSRNLGAILVTLAPEKVSTDYIGELVKRGIRVSAGHTQASYEQTKAAMKAGLDGFTHLFNAMPPFIPREPGVIGAALEGTEGYCGIIVDGHHVHPATLKTAISAKTTNRMMLVSDAMPPVGSDIQSFTLGTQEITVKEGRCCTADGTLAGSCISLVDGLRNCLHLLNLPLNEALEMASSTPARFMGLNEQIGEIKSGCAADFTVLSCDGAVIAVL